jgi:hypothetical protein
LSLFCEAWTCLCYKLCRFALLHLRNTQHCVNSTAQLRSTWSICIHTQVNYPSPKMSVSYKQKKERVNARPQGFQSPNSTNSNHPVTVQLKKLFTNSWKYCEVVFVKITSRTPRRHSGAFGIPRIWIGTSGNRGGRQASVSRVSPPTGGCNGSFWSQSRGW